MCARLLVVEDNEPNLALMAYLLRAHGHTVLTATDGEEALTAVRRAEPDLIVCDVQIPKVDGYGVARQLKGQPAFSKIPLVAVTALAMVGDRDQVLSRGFDAYISKPINPETFVSEIEALLASASRSAQRVKADAQVGGLRGTILVVDDVPINSQFVRSALEPLGYQVIDAKTVEDALPLARQHRLDLILSDIHMTAATGIALIEACRADPELSSIPVMIMSNTYFAEEDRERCLSLGAVDFILRPVEAKELVSRVERQLRAA